MILAALFTLALASDPAAAEEAWDQRFVAQTDEQRLEHAQSYVREHGKAGGAFRLLAAHAIAADILWRRSCPVDAILGACLSFETAERTFATCEPNAKTLVLHDRAIKPERRARKHFRAALALVDEAREEPAEPEELALRQDVIDDLRANAGALALERALVASLHPPRPLRFVVEEWKHDSGLPKWEREYLAQVGERERVRDWIGDVEASIDTFVEEQATMVHPAVGRARSGLLAFAKHLAIMQSAATPMPSARRTRQRVLSAEQRCHAARDLVVPLRARAQREYDACVAEAAAAGVWLDASRWCEGELIETFARTREPLREIVSRPASVRGAMARYTVQTNLDQVPTVDVVRDDWAAPQRPKDDLELGRATLPELGGYGRRTRARRGKLRVSAHGRHDADVIARVADRFSDAVHRCRQRTKDATVSTLRLALSGNGTVIGVSKADTALAACIGDVFEHVSFPPPADESTTIVASVVELRFAADRRPRRSLQR